MFPNLLMYHSVSEWNLSYTFRVATFSYLRPCALVYYEHTRYKNFLSLNKFCLSCIPEKLYKRWSASFHPVSRTWLQHHCTHLSKKRANIFLLNAGIHLQYCYVSWPRGPQSEYSLPWKHKTCNIVNCYYYTNNMYVCLQWWWFCHTKHI